MIKRLKTKYGVFLSILVLFSIVVTLSYSAFIFSTGKYRSTELLISKLNYGITITEDKTNLSSISGSKVTVPKGSITYYNIVISSINKIDSKYTLAYKTSSNAVVKYTDRTPWNTSGYIKGYDENTYSKRIRVVIDNSSSTSSSTVDFAVYGGYTFNTYASIELNSGYVTVTGPYTEELASISNRLVDIVENDTGCVTSESSTCLYGGDSIKNYVQYPTNEDKTKNIWRILGSYIIDGETVTKMIKVDTVTNLDNLYNTLTDNKSIILSTNKFNCFSNICNTSNYTNIGILTNYEYNQIGGNNSYLQSLNPFLVKTENGFNEVTDNGINEGVTSSNLKPVVYIQTEVQTSGSGSISDPYTLTPSSDINLVAYTLNGQSTTKTYAELLTTNVVKNVTCKNGSTTIWDYDNNYLTFTSIKVPDYCTIDFTDGYIVTLTSSNGTVSPTSQAVGSGRAASFTVTPNDGYKLELESSTCDGTLSGNKYTISNITSNKTCTITFKPNIPTLYDKLLADKTTRPGARTDFSTVLTTNNTKTLYTSTEDSKTVYYFAGNATDNWVKFGKNASNQDLYWRIIRTNSDGSVRLLYHGTSTTATDTYIGTSAFNSSYADTAYVSYMYGSLGSIPNARENTTDSTIKTTIDNWYKDNLNTNYGKYLSTTAVYCNDRSTSDNTNFGAYTRLNTNKTPSYDCAATEDKFTVDTSTGNGKLTYPIALMTADEVRFAGGVYGINAPTWYYYNSSNGSSTGSTLWWLLSPSTWTANGIYASVFRMLDSSYPGRLTYNAVYSSDGVRPVISLKSCIKYSTGNGSANAPYTILDTETGC